MALGAKLFGVAAHDIGDPIAGIEPSLVVLGPLPFQQPADVMQLADIDAAEWRRAQHVHKRRGPAVIAWEIHEILWSFGHHVSSVYGHSSHTGARPTGLAVRPSRRLSAPMRRISSSSSLKSNTSIFSAMRVALEERGIAAIICCCISQRNATWAQVLPLRRPMSVSTGSPAMRPRASGQ